MIALDLTPTWDWPVLLAALVAMIILSFVFGKEDHR